MDLTTNGVVITDVIKFVEQQSKEKVKSSEKEKEENNNELKEYDAM
jgi:hypothetical protein